MGKEKLVAPCGLYCGGCYVFKAGRDKALAQEVATRYGVSPDEVRCRSCRVEKGACKLLFKGRVCPTYNCAVNLKKLNFCYECEDFPCLKLAPAADRAQEIPHNMKIYNLVSIQKMGLQNWLKQAEIRWDQYYQGKKPRGGDDLQV